MIQSGWPSWRRYATRGIERPYFPSEKALNLDAVETALCMLVAALMGLDRMRAAYAYAIENGYRFYSYGDASLLVP